MNPVLPSPRFDVQEVICDDTKKDIQKFTLLWHRAALSELGRKGLSLMQEGRLCATSAVAACISQKITSQEAVGEIKRLFACYDKKGNLQSVALAKEVGESFFLSSIVSHPFRTKENKGAGTCLTHHLFRTCVEEGKKSVCVYPLASSMGFYRKVGFYPPEPGEKELCPMHITSEKIKALLKFENASG